MATFKELQAQIAKLQAQAENARAKEVSAVVTQIHGLVKEYGITPADLGFGPAAKRSKRKTTVAAAKYADPVSGATWTGRGRAPAWIAGHDKEKFAIAAA